MDRIYCDCGKQMKYEQSKCDSCEAKIINNMWSFYIDFHGFDSDGQNVWRNKERNFKIVFEGYAYCIYSYMVDYHNNERTVLLTNLQDPYVFNDFMDILNIDLSEEV